MRVAIIGGGFYGCYIASEIKRKFKGIDVDIFDKNDALLLEAAINNQARLHLGFHYPRSPLTIEQTISGFHHFVERFSRFINFPRTNIYAIHKDSLTTFDEYVKVFDDYHIYYENFEGNLGAYFKDPSIIDGALIVGEGVIDLLSLREYLLKKINKQYLRCNVDFIQPDTGCFYCGNKAYGPYEWIINTTYLNPNLGMDALYSLKYELACLLVIHQPFDVNIGITIMDGEFVSLYPATDNTATLSSVLYTPYASFLSLTDLNAFLNSDDLKLYQLRAALNISNHAQQFLKINPNILGTKLSTKCKLRDDVGDTRETEVRQYGKVISVLCGKLDAVHIASESILHTITN